MTILIAIVLSFSRSYADDQLPYSSSLANLTKDSRCALAFQRQARKFSPDNLWTRSVGAGEIIYRVPTKKIGAWLELKIDEAFNLSLSKVDDSGFETWRADWPSCALASKKIRFSRKEIFSDGSGHIKYFTDYELEKILKTGESGLIYLWSPGMVYSVQYIETFREIAKKLNLRFVEVMDPNVKTGFANEFLKKAKRELATVKNDSIELSMRNGQTHFPTTFVFSNGHLAREPITGVYNSEQLESAIKRNLMVLR